MSNFLQGREKVLAILLMGIFFLLNLSIASRSPVGGWMDEVFYVDPGLNLAAGKGWISTVTPYQTDHEFFAVGSPLFPGGLSLWAHFFGVSMVSARSYCYFLFALGTLLLWSGSFRFNLLTPAYRLFWIVILSTEYGMNWMARNDRYDVWIFVGLSLAWLGASLNGRVKYAVIFLGGLLVSFGGFVGVPYVFFAAGLASIVTKLRVWREAVAAIIGAVSGVLGVGLFYAVNGSLQTFRTIVGHYSVAQQSGLHAPYLVFLYPREDWAVGVMIFILAILSWDRWRHPLSGSLPWLGLAWGMVVLMPCVMLLRGFFGMMYFYMLIVPLTLSLLQLISQVWAERRPHYLAIVATVIMGALCLSGLPVRLYFSCKEWSYRDPQHRLDFVRAYIRPDDAVYSDYPFYFELRDYVRFVAMPFYYSVIPPDEAKRINVAIVDNRNVPDLSHDDSALSKFGGGWKKVAVFPTAEMMTELQGKAFHDETYTLYRRDVGAP